MNVVVVQACKTGNLWFLNLVLSLVILVSKIIIMYTILNVCNGSWRSDLKQIRREVYMECTLAGVTV